MSKAGIFINNRENALLKREKYVKSKEEPSYKKTKENFWQNMEKNKVKEENGWRAFRPLLLGE
ncbi:MAG: hypothetical protein ACXQTV_03495 [Candidatus Hecatellaceae archaeon]